MLHVIIIHLKDTGRAILEADVAICARSAWCAAVLNVFKHACSAAPQLQAVHGHWAALNARLSDDFTAIVKTFVMSEKERASWVPYSEWCAAGKRLARDEYRWRRHLLVALSCRIPPARGGDYGLLHIVSSDAPLTTGDHRNLLIWGGDTGKPSTILLINLATQRHTHEAVAAVGASHNRGIIEGAASADALRERAQAAALLAVRPHSKHGRVGPSTQWCLAST